MRARGVVMAMVLLVGLAACGAGGSSDVATGDLPKLPRLLAATSGASTMEARSSAAPAADMAIYPASPIEYRLAPGTKAPATSAAAYRVVPQHLSDDDIARMARALGLTGPVTTDGQAKVVRSGQVELRIDGGPVRYWNYTPYSREAMSSGSAVSCSPDGRCDEVPQTAPVAGLPSAAEAEAKAGALLEAMGIGGRVSSPYPEEARAFQRVAVWATDVDGIEVMGLGGSVTFGEHGRIDWAGGSLARLEKVGDYPLVSMETAVERLNEMNGGATTMRAEAGTAEIDPATDQPATASGGGVSGSPGSTGHGGAVSSDSQTASASDDGGKGQSTPGEPGTAEPARDQPMSEPQVTQAPQVIEITGARVALAVTYGFCADDPVYAVPAFAFVPETAGTVVAVQDSALEGTGAASRDVTTSCPGLEPTGPVVKPEPAIEPATDPARPEPAAPAPDAVESQPAPAPPDR